MIDTNDTDSQVWPWAMMNQDDFITSWKMYLGHINIYLLILKSASYENISKTCMWHESTPLLFVKAG